MQINYCKGFEIHNFVYQNLFSKEQIPNEWTPDKRTEDKQPEILSIIWRDWGAGAATATCWDSGCKNTIVIICMLWFAEMQIITNYVKMHTSEVMKTKSIKSAILGTINTCNKTCKIP